MIAASAIAAAFVANRFAALGLQPAVGGSYYQQVPFVRSSVKPGTRGRMTIDDFVTLMAWHDDNHLDQLRRALDSL